MADLITYFHIFIICNVTFLKSVSKWLQVEHLTYVIT